MSQASFSLQGRNPDVLTCIANLSNDEVFTPPELANDMLDTLTTAWASSNDGASIWADKSVTFLDPFTKSGVFLREITSRLTKGLVSPLSCLIHIRGCTAAASNHIAYFFGCASRQITQLLAHAFAKPTATFATPSPRVGATSNGANRGPK